MFCNDCKQDKAKNFFYPSMKYRCKECQKARMRSNYTYDKGKLRRQKMGASYFAEASKRWREKYPVRSKDAKKRAYDKRKKETGLTSYESKEHKARRMAVYRENHREELRQKSRERYYRIVKTEDGRKYWRAIVHRRLDRGSHISASMIKSIEQANIKKYGTLTCEYCKIPLGDKYHLEHKTPISRGGKSIKINLCIACPECNLSKGTLTALEYRKRLRAV